MIRIQQIKVPLKHDSADIEQKIRKRLRLEPEDAFTFEIRRQSIDARRKNEVSYVYAVDVDLEDLSEEEVLRRAHNPNVMPAKTVRYHFPPAGSGQMKQRPVIAGSGPAGLFCAYLLALYGYRPIVLERGKMADQRRKDVEQFWKEGRLHPSSNVQFGEGGAGTFSDGKLNTLEKDAFGRNRFVLETLAECGADSSILYTNKPHIGTDMLVKIVKNLREEIIRIGGTFYFETCLTGIQTEDGRLRAVTVSESGQERQMETEHLILAIGHSARDTFEMLERNHIPMEAKAFAVGLRVEHPQSMINHQQYKGADMQYLPPASYKLTAPYEGGKRGVYSFCMCPGGYVVNASSEAGHLTLNGMSYHDRGGSNANSAVIVSVTPDDFPDTGSPLRGIAFQRQLETRAYALGNGRIPQQLYGDYKAGRPSDGYGDFASQAKGVCTFADLGTLLPDPLKEAFISAMERFASHIPDFNRYDTVLSGIESRTSSPVRILRNEQRQSAVEGIYPCGEGAGYAGGIMSAAIDGIKTAEALRAGFKPF